jgi:hypothetical protein
LLALGSLHPLPSMTGEAAMLKVTLKNAPPGDCDPRLCPSA